MFIPIKRKRGHIFNLISKKSVKRFIGAGLRISAANASLAFHQTLSFPGMSNDPKAAKGIFNKFMKSFMKCYGKKGVSAFHVQETRKTGAIHFHVFFLIFTPEKLDFSPSRIERDLRTDIFKRWTKLNSGLSVHMGNKLIARKCDVKTLEYFCASLTVADKATERSKVNWWGFWNKRLVFERSASSPAAMVNDTFNKLFKFSNRNSRMNLRMVEQTNAIAHHHGFDSETGYLATYLPELPISPIPPNEPTFCLEGNPDMANGTSPTDYFEMPDNECSF